MAREYQVVAGLAGTGVPVPRAVALGRDHSVLGVPFSAVEYVPGRVIRTQQELHALPATQIARCAYGLIDVLARLHAVQADAVGLGGFGRPRGYLARQIRRWQDQWNRVSTRALPDIDTLHRRLVETCPAESGASIVHGDFRIDGKVAVVTGASSGPGAGLTVTLAEAGADVLGARRADRLGTVSAQVAGTGQRARATG